MLDSSKEIIERAISQYSPYAIVSMISGGNDSVCAYLVAKELAVPVTHILHGITGTGIAATTQFVREFAAKEDPVYLEADAGNSYVEYVQRKGFFGRGVRAHSYSYHMLKAKHFRRVLSANIRQRKRNRPILMINGARTAESSNRARNMVDPVRVDGNNNNIWVNICHDWTQADRDAFLERVNAPCNPVTKKLCRSGECLCGTQQSKATREEVSFYFPEWGRWLDELEAPVKARFGWGWGDETPRRVVQEKTGQAQAFQPLCVDCNDFAQS